MSHDIPELEALGIRMVVAGLPYAFVLQILELARTSEGVCDLMHLWTDAPDTAERAEVEAALQEALDDRLPPGPAVRIQSLDDADQLLEQRRALKAHLRELVDAHGGVSAVARRADMLQPALSRLLNSMSAPRPTTLHRLARAMGLPIDALTSKV